MKKIVILLILAIIIIGVVWVVRNRTKESPDRNREREAIENVLDEITITSISMPVTSPQILINRFENIFEQELEGININYIITRGRDGIYGVLENEQTDFAYMPLNAYIVYTTENSTYGGGQNYTLIASSTIQEVGGYLVAGSEINNLADLDGKVVGIVNDSYTQELLLNRVLEEYGLKTESLGGTVKVEYIDDLTNLYNDFGEGKIDAVYGRRNDSTLTISKEKRKEAHIVYDIKGSEYYDEMNSTVLIVKNTFIEEHPLFVEQFLKTHIKASKLSAENKGMLPDLNFNHIKDYYKSIGAEGREDTYDIKEIERRWLEATASYKVNYGFINSVYAFMEQVGYIENNRIEDLINLELLEKVLEDTQ